VTAAGATGAHHVARRLRYEDAWAAAPADSLNTDQATVIAAVADGHGHSRHFRSAQGAELAVAVAVQLGTALAIEITDATDADDAERVLRTRLAPAIVATWREHVRRDLDENPVTADEFRAAELGPTATFDELLYGYGATLLVAVATTGWLGCLQLGDGDLFVIAPDGSSRRPVPTDPRLDGRRTTSLCQPDAVESIRYGVVDLSAEPVGAVMLATDGFGNAQLRPDWTDAFGPQFATAAARHGAGWVGSELPVWVRDCASIDGSGDDVTAVVVVATDTTWSAAGWPAAGSPPDDAGPTALALPSGRHEIPADDTLSSNDAMTVSVDEPDGPAGERPKPTSHRTASPADDWRRMLLIAAPVILVLVAAAVGILLAL
jgi:hypothetical protein